MPSASASGPGRWRPAPSKTGSPTQQSRSPPRRTAPASPGAMAWCARPRGTTPSAGAATARRTGPSPPRPGCCEWAPRRKSSCFLFSSFLFFFFFFWGGGEGWGCPKMLSGSSDLESFFWFRRSTNHERRALSGRGCVFICLFVCLLACLFVCI